MSTVRKTYVLDTSVLLGAPNAIHQFAEHQVVLPLVVIKELESKRNDPMLGFPAREALRGIEALRTRGELRSGVTVNDLGGTVRIEINHVSKAALPDALTADRTHDTRILAVAKNLLDEGADVTVISKDLPMRLLADALGLTADEYRNEMVVVDQQYTGIEDVEVPADVIDSLYAEKVIDAVTSTLGDLELVPNLGVVLRGPNSSALARVTPDKTLELVQPDIEAFGVRGRSAEQRIAMAHMLDPAVGIVSLGGQAGTGKSFGALSAGLEQVLETRQYKRIMVFRPMYAVGGQDLGYLPGTAEEKMAPWGAAVQDALQSMTTQTVIDELAHRQLLEVLPLTHIRGRSLADTFVIVDEAQSLEKPVLLTALSRLGENSKAVLAWDAAQRDNLRVGRYDGVAALVERLKGEPLFAHTTLHRSERGPVAAMVSRCLDDFGN